MPPPLTDAGYDARWNAKVAAGEQRGYSPNKVYGMKRRFSLATIAAMIVAASLLLALLKAVNAPPLTSALILGFIAVTAISQMLLFDGKRPRLASMVAGAVFWPALILVLIFADVGRRGWQNRDDLVSVVFVNAILGTIFGYGAGGTVAGVLLLMDLVESWLPAKRLASKADDEPWPPTKPASPQAESSADSTTIAPPAVKIVAGESLPD